MTNLYELAEIAGNKLISNEIVDIDTINSLKNFISDGGFIGLSQINPIAGNIEYNAKKIAQHIKFAESIGLETVISPNSWLRTSTSVLRTVHWWFQDSTIWRKLFGMPKVLTKTTT